MELPKNPWMIVGCGYTGARLARRLIRDGAPVMVTRRSAGDAEALARALGCRGAAVDLAAPASLRGVIAPGAIVVDSAPPTEGDTAGERALVAACAEARARRLVYLSSTGVYPQASGEWVDEQVAPAPFGRHGEARLAAESAVLDEAAARGVDAVSLRIAGIYGPGRGVHHRLRAGSYRIIGDGNAHVSRVHVDDLVAAIVAAGAADRLPGRVYNVADDDPSPSAALGDALALALGVPKPPRVAPEEVSEAARAMLGADRRIANGRLKRDLGWAPRYPTALDGAVAAAAEEDLLDEDQAAE